MKVQKWVIFETQCSQRKKVYLLGIKVFSGSVGQHNNNSGIVSRKSCMALVEWPRLSGDCVPAYTKTYNQSINEI